jgi:hypothetical protein
MAYDETAAMLLIENGKLKAEVERLKLSTVDLAAMKKVLDECDRLRAEVERLTAENMHLRKRWADLANNINVKGSHYDKAMDALEGMLRLVKPAKPSHRRSPMSDIDADLAFGAVEAMQATIDKQAAEIERLRAALEPEFLGRLIYETWLKATNGPSWVSYEELAYLAPDDRNAIEQIVIEIRARAALAKEKQ